MPLPQKKNASFLPLAEAKGLQRRRSDEAGFIAVAAPYRKRSGVMRAFVCSEEAVVNLGIQQE